MITYKVERIASMLEEFNQLLSEHMAEMNYFEMNGAKFDPDYDRYIRGQDAGHYIVVTARDNGELVGYAVFGIAPHMRFKSTVYAYEDLYYVEPDHRRQGIARQLFVEIEKLLTERGVAFVLATTKTYHDRTGLLEQSGYKHFEKVFCKQIKELA